MFLVGEIRNSLMRLCSTLSSKPRISEASSNLSFTLLKARGAASLFIRPASEAGSLPTSGMTWLLTAHPLLSDANLWRYSSKIRTRNDRPSSFSILRLRGTMPSSRFIIRYDFPAPETPNESRTTLLPRITRKTISLIEVF